jgi:hypothetical protein
MPELTNRTRINIQALSKGVQRNGTVGVRRWLQVGSKDADLQAQFRNVDLAQFEPYLIAKLKSGIYSGSFNLDLTSRVRKNTVDASSTMTVIALKLKPSTIRSARLRPRRAPSFSTDWKTSSTRSWSRSSCRGTSTTRSSP